MTRYNVIPAKAGIQTPSLRKQGTINNWVPVFTANPGFLVKPGMTKQGECLHNYGLIIKSQTHFFSNLPSKNLTIVFLWISRVPS
jgi:hypothetical protein